jgi:hypothetical protein
MSKPMTVRETVLAALKKAPHGLTTRALAKVTGRSVVSVSSCASRLASYGKLERDFVREVRTVEHEAILWRAPSKEPHAKP